MASILALALRSTFSSNLPIFLALLGLSLAGLFDTIHVNQQTANLLIILLSFSLVPHASCLMPSSLDNSSANNRPQ